MKETNRAYKLFDKEFITDFFQKNILPLYRDFSGIIDIKIHGHKKNIWKGGTYHVVIEYTCTFSTKDGKRKKLPIFCSAHSDEPRKNVYDALKFLWDNGFSKGYHSIPHALFYSREFVATFYRGVAGINLYKFIRDNKREEIRNIIPKAAKWFAKLHSIDARKARNFNKENSRIETVFPGIKHILWRIENDYPEYAAVFREIYGFVNEKEKEFLNNTDRRWLVHGDAHPENIIKMSPRKIAVIDFTDLCLSDFARDLGAFLQQLEFMTDRKINDRKFTKEITELFLNSYSKYSGAEIDAGLRSRIDNYYYWTAMRTAQYFMIKAEAEPERAFPLICRVCEALNIKSDYSKIC